LPANQCYWRVAKQVEEFFRCNYYGGRVQINAYDRKYDCLISSFDINSSYPAQMRKGVPYGQAEQVFEGQYIKGRPGFYSVTVSIPDNLDLPPIPHKNMQGKLSFPTGTFKTYLSSLELDYLSEIGGTFISHGGYYFPEGLCYPFAEFVDVCEAKRAEYKGKPTEGVVKLIQNSLYGKFGTRTEGRKIAICYDDDLPPPGYCPITDEGSPTKEIVPNIYYMPEERDACYMLPHWSAWITANARLELDRYIRIAGANNVLYVDTDSVKVTPEGAANIQGAQGCIGKVYGQLKHEGDFSDFRVHAPKCYTGYYFGGPDHAKEYYAVKGIPKKLMQKDVEIFLAIHNSEPITVKYQSPTSYLTYGRVAKFEVTRTRSATKFENVYGHIREKGRFRARRAEPRDLLSNGYVHNAGEYWSRAE
jgi:hypothetical protein